MGEARNDQCCLGNIEPRQLGSVTSSVALRARRLPAPLRTVERSNFEGVAPWSAGLGEKIDLEQVERVEQHPCLIDSSEVLKLLKLNKLSNFNHTSHPESGS